MNEAQGIKLASRALAIFLIAWAISDALDLPHNIMSLRHYMVGFAHSHSDAGNERYMLYFLELDCAYLVEKVLRIILWLVAARWLYACGPWIRAFFEDSQTEKVVATERSL